MQMMQRSSRKIWQIKGVAQYQGLEKDTVFVSR